jgi:PKD repeat protein
MNKALLAIAAVLCTQAANAVITNIIQTVSPASAPQGSTGLWVTFTLNSTPPPPPTSAPISSVYIGGISGTPAPHTNQYVIAAQFTIPGTEPAGAKDVLLSFAGNVVGYRASGFTVTAPTTLTADFVATPTNGIIPLVVAFTDASIGTVTNRLWSFGDTGTSTEANPVHTYNAPGSYPVSLTVWGPLGSNTLTRAGYVAASLPPTNGAYVIVDTGQTNCYGTTGTPITCPSPGQTFYGQDSQVAGNQPAYRNNGDGTISDLNTGLMWVQARGAKIAWESARTNATNCTVGGYNDWRMPTIKELYSLIQFTGANGQGFTNTVGYIPFIDTNYFGFAYGSGIGDERVIDCQDWSATKYVSTTMNSDATVFGVNFADGRIKGYPQYVYNSGCACTTNNLLYVRYVRGNPSYEINKLVNNGDGTISDKATRLMWSRNDSGTGLNWTNALAWVQAQNAVNYLGHNDWRLPNAKELQSIVDYTRSPATTASAAISPVFNCTGITNEANVPDFPFYWASTTLLTGPGKGDGVYVCFGRAMGYMNSTWVDAHGAGAQRSDSKSGSLSDYAYAPYGYYSPLAPQADAVRLHNYVRLVRDIPATNAWRFAFVGDTHVPLTTIASEIAAAAANDDARLLLVAGDLVESGTAASTNTLLSQLAAWRDEMTPLTAAGIPVYVLRGNHEDDVPGGLAAWNSFFSGAYAMPGDGPAAESNLTFSFTCNNALFIGLDQYANIHRVNQSWLNQRLATNQQPHLFVFGHEPAFKAFHTDCLDDYPTERNAFWNSLAGAGARVYLCGHDHLLNVARIDDGDGNPGNDLYQFIVGTGGSTNWPVNRYTYNGTNAPFTPVNVSSVTNSCGYLLVEVSGPGTNDLSVTLTWKQRTYDANTASYLFVGTTNVLSYSAVNRLADSVGDGIPDWWRAQYFGGPGQATNSQSCATCDPDGDGANNYAEYVADTNPTNALSRFRIQSVSKSASFTVSYPSSASRKYTLYYSTNLALGGWTNLPAQTGIWGSGDMDALTDPASSGGQRFYRVGVHLP